MNEGTKGIKKQYSVRANKSMIKKYAERRERGRKGEAERSKETKDGVYIYNFSAYHSRSKGWRR